MEIGAKNDIFEPEKVKKIPVPKLTFPPGLRIFCRCPGLENRKNKRLKLFKNTFNNYLLTVQSTRIPKMTLELLYLI